MTQPIQLVQLKCVHCQTPLSANEEEIAWQCPQCGQGTHLTPTGLAPVTLVWVAARQKIANLRWFPFWVFSGKVNFTRRETYRGNEQPNPIWQRPTRFYIPAFSAPIDNVESLGAAFTQTQPNFKSAPAAGRFNDCTLLPEDAFDVAEFVVLNIEAERQDMLRQIEFVITERTAPELWLIPFDSKPEQQALVAV